MSKHKHTSRKKKIIRNVVCTVFSFLMMVCLMILFAFFSLQFGFFNRDTTLSQINASGYYTNVYEELTNNLHTIATSKDLPEDIFDEVITEKRVYINGKQYIENSLKNKDTKLSLTDIEKELKQTLENYYQEQGLSLDDTVTNDVKSTVSAVSSEYSRMTRFQFVNYVRQYKQAVDAVFRWLVPVAAVLALLLMVLLLTVVKYRHRGIRFIAISFFAAGGSFLILPLCALLGHWYEKALVKPEYYSQFLNDYIASGLSSFLYVGVFGMIVGVGLLFLVRMVKNRLK